MSIQAAIGLALIAAFIVASAIDIRRRMRVAARAKAGDIDLATDEYQVKNPRSGVWQVRDNPRLLAFMLLVMIGLLVWLFVTRDEGTTASLFTSVAICSVCAGAFMAMLLRDY